MSKIVSISPSEVDFWLDSDKYSNYFEEQIDPSNTTIVFNIDMVRLASIRKSISNFVRILTQQNIPVYFNNADANVNFAGKVIYISSAINNKLDYDIAVGLALHEGSHTLLTDFDILKAAQANVPHDLFVMSDSKNIRRSSIEKFIKDMWNVIEDRYIDDYVFNEAPGYRGYYFALYNRYWNCIEIDTKLASDLFRYPSLASYDFRIPCLINPNSDITALPKLDEISKLIDFDNISRLKTTKSRIKLAFDVVKVVLGCLGLDGDDLESTSKSSNDKDKDDTKKIIDPRDFFDFGDTDSEESVDIGKKSTKELGDILTGKNTNPQDVSENKDIVNKISDAPLDKETQKEVDKAIKLQRQFLHGDIEKKPITSAQKSLLDLIEKHGIVLVQVEMPKLLSGDENNLKVDCVVVNNMSKELVLAGNDIFPLSSVKDVGINIPTPPADVADAVKRGIQLGTKLGRKLQIRAESNTIKSTRKRSGKINKRYLHAASYDAEDLFYKIHIDEHKIAILHISVDASSSMVGDKWIRTMVAVVAICKAASMIDNIHVTVSFRATQHSESTDLPYVILAYDSKKDKFSKVKTLFPYLIPNGCTPEGLAFGAIMNLFGGITPDEEDRYFLNISDGEPCYVLTLPGTRSQLVYQDDIGSAHTKIQVDKIRSYGVKVLSYFIENDYNVVGTKINKSKKSIKDLDNSPLRKNFRKMYGRDAKFLDVNSVVDLARTMNDFFLSNEKDS